MTSYLLRLEKTILARSTDPQTIGGYIRRSIERHNLAPGITIEEQAPDGTTVATYTARQFVEAFPPPAPVPGI